MDALLRYCFGAILRLAFLLAATTIRAPQVVMIPQLSPLALPAFRTSRKQNHPPPPPGSRDVAYGRHHADPAGFGDAFEAGGNIDAIIEDVVVIDDDVPNVIDDRSKTGRPLK